MPSSDSGIGRKLLARVSLGALRGSERVEEEDTKRLSALESYRLVSAIGQGEEGEGWEVEVTRALIVSSLHPNKEGGSARASNQSPSTRRAIQDAPSHHSSHLPNTHTITTSTPAKIPQSRRPPLASVHNTIGSASMPDPQNNGTDKVTPPSPAAKAPLPANSHAHDPDTSKTRPIITPSSLSRRTAATTRSFSSLPPPKITTDQSGSTSPSLLAPPPTLAVIAPTPDPSPVTPGGSKRVHHKSVPETPSSVLRNPGLEAPQVQKSWSSGSTGKRKAEEVEGEQGTTTPPREQRATFAPEPRTHRASAASTAPSSYRRKRARLSLPSDGSNTPSRSGSVTGMGSVAESPNAKNTGSWSSKRSARASVPPDSPRRAPSASTQSHTRNNSYSHSYQGHAHASSSTQNISSSRGPYTNHPAPSRRSLSQASIPISALISPHAPSIAHSGTFHMRDPRKPAPVQTTPWSLSFPARVERGVSRWEWRGWVERGGSPLHAWIFFVGFAVFPIWWVASFVGVPRTRRLAAGDGVEKGVVLDDPQVEFDARSWRTRCRVMAGISFVTYVPFIVLVIVFAR